MSRAVRIVLVLENPGELPDNLLVPFLFAHCSLHHFVSSLALPRCLTRCPPPGPAIYRLPATISYPVNTTCPPASSGEYTDSKRFTASDSPWSFCASASAKINRCKNIVGSSLSCHARYICVPGSFSCTYQTNSSMAFFTLDTAEGFTL